MWITFRILYFKGEHCYFPTLAETQTNNIIFLLQALYLFILLFMLLVILRTESHSSISRFNIIRYCIIVRKKKWKHYKFLLSFICILAWSFHLNSPHTSKCTQFLLRYLFQTHARSENTQKMLFFYRMTQWMTDK